MASSSKKTEQAAPLAADIQDTPSNWVLSDPKRNKHGGLTSFVNPEKGSFNSVLFQTTPMYTENRCVAPFGVSEPYDPSKKGGGGGGGDAVEQKVINKDRLNMQLHIHDAGLLKFLENAEAALVKAAVENSAKPTWFKKQLTPEQVDSLIKHVVEIEYPKNKDGTVVPDSKPYPPCFRAKVNVGGAPELLTEVYMVTELDEVNKKIKCQRIPSYKVQPDVKKHSQVVAVCQITGVWFMSKEFGLGITVKRMFVFPPKRQVDADFNMGEFQMEIDDVYDAPAADDTTGDQQPTGAVATVEDSFNPLDHASYEPAADEGMTDYAGP